jgi:TRAP-type C4-dicarboxylate transport system substrate-binding protein
MVGLITALASNGAKADTVTVKLTTLAPKGSSWVNVLQEVGENWKKVSDDRVALKIYPGGVAGDEISMVSKMRIGQYHAAALTSTGLSEIEGSVRVLQVPMLYQSDAELDYVRNKLTPLLEQRIEKKGYKVLTWGEAGWAHFFATSPIARPDDLKSLKLLTSANDHVVLDLWKANGFNPVPLSPTDILPSLETGMINAFAAPPMVALSFHWYHLAPNMTDLRWSPVIGATVIKKQIWDQTPADARKAMMDIAHKAGDKLQADIRRGNEDALGEMVKRRLRIVPVPHDVRAEWLRRTEDVYPKLLDRFVPRETFQEAVRLVKEFRARAAGPPAVRDANLTGETSSGRKAPRKKLFDTRPAGPGGE